MTNHPSNNTGSSRKNWQYVPEPQRASIDRGYAVLVAVLLAAVPAVVYILSNSH